jgi:prepilin-type processing-associated H-X9-DG protein
LLPQVANAQGAAKGLQCLVFASATVRSNGDSGFASATISKAGYVLTGGGCQIAMADGSVPAKPPGVYQNKPEGNNWVCRAHNGSGAPIGAFTVTAYAVGCGF